jgi:excisionase family DNA binding protein
MDNEILTLKEVAELLKCSTSTVRSLIDRRKLAALNLGTKQHKHYRVTRQSLDAFLDVDAHPAPSAPIPETLDLDLQPIRFLRIS